MDLNPALRAIHVPDEIRAWRRSVYEACDTRGVPVWIHIHPEDEPDTYTYSWGIAAYLGREITPAEHRLFHEALVAVDAQRPRNLRPSPALAALLLAGHDS